MSRRADRLFQIVQVLRTRRHVTAALLAERLEVSERTIYRDIRDLSLSGVPIQGESGSGYRLMPGFDLPPLMFTSMEVEALIAAIGMLQTWSGDVLARAAGSAQEKLIAVLPHEKRIAAERNCIISPNFNRYPQVRVWFDVIHQAMRLHQELHIQYENDKGESSERVIHPLGLSFMGAVWVLVSWCLLRNDYRCFRLDRCKSVTFTGQPFAERADRSMQAFIALQKRQRQ
ncbi:YafY family protein [Kosakonia sp. BK9b]|uniref:helix-turn-helix transcriptional regulator n=1 Tax=Kosakonia sp. TaxID=1916651 RepID=UPI00289CEA22|nr:YafY family protein [Kosakonia sp.]